MTWTYSPSQVDTFQRCMRQWAWRKIAGVDAPTSAAQELGQLVHLQQEIWLRYGLTYDFTHRSGEIAYAGARHLPAPGTPGMSIEEPFAIYLDGRRWIGIKDVQVLSDPPLVVDHKTTRDFAYAKTVDELRTNLQAAVYAADAMIRTGAQSCDLLWLYYRTTGAPAALPVRVNVTRDDVQPVLERAIESADLMAWIVAEGLQPLDLPPSPEACAQYGGCPYATRCNLTISEIHMANEAMQKLLAKRKAAAAANGAPATVNPPDRVPEKPARDGLILTPDGKHQLVDGQWVPYEPLPEPTIPATGGMTKADLADALEAFARMLRG